jgi:CheY-like chemotaxis protein
MTRKLILAVDDNATNLKLVRYVLESAGYDVVTAEDAADARRRLDERRPTVVLLDLQLPDGDGLEFARRLKADPNTKDIPVVAVTARAMKGDRDLALSAGCDGYVSKPIDTNEFPNVVAKFVEQVTNKERPHD